MSDYFYRDYLKEELSRRTDNNPRYSLRAFARALDIDPTGLSKILASKKSLSLKTAKKITTRLPLSAEQRHIFLSSVVQEQRTRSLERVQKGVREFEKTPPKELDMDVFRVIADWYHYCILELSLTEGFKSDVRWISKALGISVIEAKLAIERLLTLGLLEEKEGKLKKTNKMLATGDTSKTSPAHIKHQMQILQKAQYSLENDPYDERCMMGMTMAIDESKIPIARKLIDEFMDSLCEFLEAGKQERVYQLGVNLFPLQKKER